MNYEQIKWLQLNQLRAGNKQHHRDSNSQRSVFRRHTHKHTHTRPHARQNTSLKQTKNKNIYVLLILCCWC